MNLILFKKEEILKPLPAEDHRYKHIVKILKLNEGDSFDSGIIGGPGGTAIIEELNSRSMSIRFVKSWDPGPLYDLTVIIGIPRPPTARRLLKDMTSAGVGRIWFTGTELGEKSYLTSKLWRDDKYMEYVLEGAQQGESTLLPEIRRFHSLRQCLAELEEGGARGALDNNESQMSISDFQAGEQSAVIAIGSERGWTVAERELLKAQQFTLLSMGTRVLRTETACSMAVGFTLAGMGKI